MDFKLKKNNLNFRVYISETEPTEPGQENDIVIVTSTPMNNWIMSPDKPSGIPRSDGDVWIQYSVTGNTFNVLKNNSMMIATISAWQYVDSVWVEVTAMSYQGGEWVAWIEIIDFDLISWTKKNPYPSRTYSEGTYDLSNRTLKGYVTGSYQHVVMVKNEKIDFSSVSKLNLVYSLDKDITSEGVLFAKISSSNSDPADSTCVVNKQIVTSATNEEVTIDVSSVNNSYYLWVGLAMWGDLGAVNFEVSKLHFK